MSYNQAQEINADLGHTITMRTPGGEKQLRVSGIYQDVTNGGRTAKPSRGLHTRSPGRLCTCSLRAGVDVRAKNRAAHETLTQRPK